mgnify:CR=1 FL=1
MVVRLCHSRLKVSIRCFSLERAERGRGYNPTRGRKVIEYARGVLDQVMTRYIEALIFQAVSENMASEQSARMVAMKAASDNATKLIDTLNLIYNKARQAAITQEISEIVGGAAAV